LGFVEASQLLQAELPLVLQELKSLRKLFAKPSKLKLCFTPGEFVLLHQFLTQSEDAYNNFVAHWLVAVHCGIRWGQSHSLVKRFLFFSAHSSGQGENVLALMYKAKTRDCEAKLHYITLGPCPTCPAFDVVGSYRFFYDRSKTPWLFTEFDDPTVRLSLASQKQMIHMAVHASYQLQGKSVPSRGQIALQNVRHCWVGWCRHFGIPDDNVREITHHVNSQVLIEHYEAATRGRRGNRISSLLADFSRTWDGIPLAKLTELMKGLIAKKCR
jgi:hypothetical protein